MHPYVPLHPSMHPYGPTSTPCFGGLCIRIPFSRHFVLLLLHLIFFLRCAFRLASSVIPLMPFLTPCSFLALFSFLLSPFLLLSRSLCLSLSLSVSLCLS